MPRSKYILQFKYYIEVYQPNETDNLQWVENFPTLKEAVEKYPTAIIFKRQEEE